MRALITGANGFVGKYLSSYLKIQDNIVLGIDRKESANAKSCDILQKEKLNEVVLKFKPELVFHLAAQSSVSKSFDEPKLTKDINVQGTRNLFDALCQIEKPRVLVVSSMQIYGPVKQLPITEATPINPKSPYAESKAEQEKLCKEYVDRLNIVIIRSFNHTGPGQNPEYVWSDFAKQIAEIEKKKSGEIQVGNIDIERDFMDVRDVVRAYFLAITKCEPKEIYNLCSANPINIRKMLEYMISLSIEDIQIVVQKSRKRNDVQMIHGDYTKFRKATGWTPEIKFEQTLSDILEYWRKTLN